MHEPTTDLPVPANLPTLMRRVLAEAAARKPDAATSGMKFKAAHPLPESMDVLKELTQEAKSFLDALRPIQNNFRSILKKIKTIKGSEVVSDHELRFCHELMASNRRKALDFGPSIDGILPYIECDMQKLRACLAAFDAQAASGTDASDEARLQRKIEAVRWLADRVVDVRVRLLAQMGKKLPMEESYGTSGRPRQEATAATKQNDAAPPKNVGGQATRDETVAPCVNLEVWAFGLETGAVWHVFRLVDHKWHHQGPLQGLGAKREARLLLRLFEGKGQLKMADALKTELLLCPGGNKRTLGPGIKQAISRLRSRLLTAMGYSSEHGTDRKPNPLEWDKPAKAYYAKVKLGTVEVSDDNRAERQERIRFRD